jgi:hypothetical protein
MMKFIKLVIFVCMFGVSMSSLCVTQSSKNILPKTAYKIGAALGVTYLLSRAFNWYIDATYAPLFEGPSPAYSKQPGSIADIQGLIQAAIQEDIALMAGSVDDWYIASFLNTMNAKALCMHSRVGSITLAADVKKHKTKKDKKSAIKITWAQIPGLSEQQMKELAMLQYEYVKEFSRAIRPQKKSYEVSSIRKNILGQKTGVYYYAPTMAQKRKVQEMHMRRALAYAERMMKLLAQALPTENGQAQGASAGK